MTEFLELNTKLNDEIASIWFQIAMKNGINDVIPHVENYLSKVGRMRYLRPNYKMFFKLNKEAAVKTFEKNRYI